MRTSTIRDLEEKQEGLKQDLRHAIRRASASKSGSRHLQNGRVDELNEEIRTLDLKIQEFYAQSVDMRIEKLREAIASLRESRKSFMSADATVSSANVDLQNEFQEVDLAILGLITKIQSAGVKVIQNGDGDSRCVSMRYDKREQATAGSL